MQVRIARRGPYRKSGQFFVIVRSSNIGNSFALVTIIAEGRRYCSVCVLCDFILIHCKFSRRLLVRHGSSGIIVRLYYQNKCSSHVDVTTYLVVFGYSFWRILTTRFQSLFVVLCYYCVLLLTLCELAIFRRVLCESATCCIISSPTAITLFEGKGKQRPSMNALREFAIVSNLNFKDWLSTWALLGQVW